ncbi:TonB-dependent receptor plug domain-containing protein [Niabella yanshanensis]|uniref:TonB-dependent receptor plug domain-containing protein n=1 Tax=Niabella yanshanensis TaxID=577386 RepID=A0ABZ0W3T5_9BACT|nr:TonB-dependent receptor plug domain-containing protein [Niabella yanshanensis]WQD36735.1 TonB-dependent receptor plug domain-containing protein [Niabella yanshanensis]
MVNQTLYCLRKRWLLVLILAIIWLPASLRAQVTDSSFVQKQPQKITGRISSQKGELLARVTVQEMGTDNATFSDEQGTYTITVSGENSQLQFSSVGYLPKTLPVPKTGVLDVALEEVIAAGDEVVVVGFGTQKKASVVGAISTVTPRQLQLTPSRSISNNLAGMVSGVLAVQRSGDPWANNSDFWIRGISTFGNASNRPLVLIDGVERNLNNIDPEEIESFSVLKDAAASAVYGVRGANGVIIINTKRGKIGAPKVTARFERAQTSPTKLPEYVGSVKYLEIMNEYKKNSGDPVFRSEEIINNYRNKIDPELYPDINW